MHTLPTEPARCPDCSFILNLMELGQENLPSALCLPRKGGDKGTGASPYPPPTPQFVGLLWPLPFPTGTWSLLGPGLGGVEKQTQRGSGPGAAGTSPSTEVAPPGAER